ncbi:ran-binding protein 16 isoform X1 [Megalopta genalis]|uniref:ran-binding protein 16 isoform X1 n=1 Tax=Megalopta genalis TaxID=115081 RepID=UPI003FD2B3C4
MFETLRMDDIQEVRQLELLCKQLYESQDSTHRAEAEKALVAFQNAPDTLAKCQLLLARGDSAYAQLLAATTLTKLVSRSGGLSLQQRLDIRNYVLNYLATQPKLPNFVIQALVTLFARISKLGWFDSDKDEFVFRNVVNDVTKFLQGSVEHYMIGVQLLSQLTCEMNQVTDVDANRSLTKHRKIASSFRDTQLFEIFKLSCTYLSTARENCKNLDFNDEAQNGLIRQLLKLAQNCLTFDFIGTSADESSEDYCAIQIPHYWKPIFLNSTYSLKLFFDLYHSLPTSLSSLALSCLVQIASVRRSLFSNLERTQFLTHLVNGVTNIIQNPRGLSDPANYHEFCRLILRLKSNFQLGELILLEHYPEDIELIAKFTVQSLRMWQFSPNSLHYLLTLWQKMVSSLPYVKTGDRHLLDVYTPEVVNAYITSRFDSVAIVVRDRLEDPLDDLAVVHQQLEQISVIGRCEYQKTYTLLVQLFDQAARAYQELLTQTSSPSQQMDITIREGQLTWLVYIIGGVIGGKVTFNNNEEYDAVDSELVCKVLQLMHLTDSQLAQGGGCEKLELAMLSFFEQFRKIYVGEQVQKNPKVYRRLSDVLGVNDESMTLGILIRKIITNLKYWGRSEQIISKTLHSLNDLSVGFSCVRKLVKLEEVQFMLNNHTGEHFPFLGNNVPVSEMRCRSMFYTSLGRLLMVDLGEDEERFHTFMLPLTGALESLGQLMGAADPSLFAAEDAKKALIGLARDLRGLAFAFNTKTSYMMLWDWIYPNYTPILLHAVELWHYEPQVTTPVLKLFAELAQNRSQRLQFDASSPHGMLLFREASKVICSYGNRILNVDVPKDQIYPLKLKGISICFSMLKATLCGNYVNFGAFRLYGDEALDNALNTFIKLLLSIPQSDLLHYSKLSVTYYLLLEYLAQDHMVFLATLEPRVFLYILSSISEGLTALDTMISTGSCSTLDHIVSYLFKHLYPKGNYARRKNAVVPGGGDLFLQVLKQHPEILQQILSTILNVIMFEDCRNQWGMSRPLLVLILLNEEYFNQLRENIIRSQPVDKQATMAQWFENLMEGVERNLLTRNRDKFTQNLSMLIKDINETMKGPYSSANVTNDNMMTLQ